MIGFKGIKSLQPQTQIFPISLQPDGVDLTYFKLKKRLEKNLRFLIFDKGQKVA